MTLLTLMIPVPLSYAAPMRFAKKVHVNARKDSNYVMRCVLQKMPAALLQIAKTIKYAKKTNAPSLVIKQSVQQIRSAMNP